MVPFEVLFWHWWILAVVLLGLEMMAAAYFFLWLGASAALVGAILLAFPDVPQAAQLGLWGVLSGVSVTGWYYYKRNRKPGEPDEAEALKLNRRGEQYVGRHFTLDQPIVNGQGKIKVDDSIWKVEAEDDHPAGVKIEVVAVDGTVLKVVPYKG